MVRLKAKDPKKSELLEFISIPYGAIKRIFSQSIIIIIIISIPYGAIKRWCFI